MVKAKVPMIGKQFGRLTVVKQAEPPEGKKGREAWYLCSCSCGGNVVIRGSSLRRNITKSCGCLQRESAIDLSSKRFGKLTVMEDSGDRRKKSGGVIWRCKCDCGQEKLVRQDSLVSGRTTSCGCVKSRGNRKIAEILSKESVNYIPEYSPDDIGGNYRFDFAVFEGEKLSYFIEYDGKQHFEYTGRGWNTEESFFMTEARDKLKDEYCSNKRLPLIRIPYTAFDDILPDDLRVDKSRYLHINVDKDEKK